MQKLPYGSPQIFRQPDWTACAIHALLNRQSFIAALTGESGLRGGVQARFDFRGARNPTAGRMLTVTLSHDLNGDSVWLIKLAVSCLCASMLELEPNAGDPVPGHIVDHKPNRSDPNGVAHRRIWG
jgi:hypothetical protein